MYNLETNSFVSHDIPNMVERRAGHTLVDVYDEDDDSVCLYAISGRDFELGDTNTYERICFTL